MSEIKEGLSKEELSKWIACTKYTANSTVITLRIVSGFRYTIIGKQR